MTTMSAFRGVTVNDLWQTTRRILISCVRVTEAGSRLRKIAYGKRSKSTFSRTLAQERMLPFPLAHVDGPVLIHKLYDQSYVYTSES